MTPSLRTECQPKFSSLRHAEESTPLRLAALCILTVKHDKFHSFFDSFLAAKTAPIRTNVYDKAGLHSNTVVPEIVLVGSQNLLGPTAGTNDLLSPAYQRPMFVKQAIVLYCR